MQKLLSRLNLDTLLKYLVAAILIFVPLYPKFPFITVPGTYVSIRVEDFLILLAVLVFFLKLATTHTFKNYKNSLTYAFILFWLITLVSVLSGIFLTKTVNLHLGILHWGRRIEYMALFFVGFQALKKEKDLALFIKCSILVVLFAFFFGLGQKYLSWPVITTQNDEYSKGVALRYMPGGHLISTFAGHYDLATYLILVSPFIMTTLLSTAFDGKLFPKSKFTKGVFFLTLLSSLWLLSNAASRISFVAYIFAFLAALILIRKYKYIPIFLAIVVFFTVFSTNLLARYDNIFEVLVKKITLLVPHPVYAQETPPALPVSTPAPQPVFEDRSTSIRLNVEWPRALRAFTKNPLLGTGFSSITLATDNDFLRLLGETGLLGLLAFLHIFLRIFKKLLVLPFKTIDLSSAYLAGILAALPAIFLNSLFIDIFEASKFAMMFWLMLGFALKLVTLKNNEEN